ncbi:MAG: hypothetical protein IJ094_05060 [Bacilli bacterium]|nr:hypothetical protein [Bacilli bacterium]
MLDERIDKIVQENESLKWLKEIADRGIVVMSPNAEKYKSDPNQLALLDYENKTISQQFIIDILSHDDSFDKIKQIYENNLFAVVTLFVDEKGRFIDQYNLSRMMTIDLLKMIDVKEFPFIEERYNQLMNYVSYEKYKEKTQNDNYEIVIDGKIYKIPVMSIYQFMDLNLESFNNAILAGNDINGIPSSHFLYAVSKYYEDNKIDENYLVNEELKNRLKEIKSSEKVDVQMVNKYLDTNDSLLEQIKVNIELQDLILSDISPEFNDLEKAIYVYIKMCKVLTYDEEFYAVNQKGPLSEKHKTIDNVANISLTNNKVVCYEFDAIYSYFLNKLGINYKHFVGTVDGNGKHGEQEFDDLFNRYSEGHTFLKYRCGKYLVKADSVTSILQGDIMQAKLNQPLKGLVCENINKQSRDEFSQAMHKVYNYIASREPRISQNEPEKVETFDEIIAQFTSLTDKLKQVDIREKIEILINKVNSTRMIGIDAYSYLLQLRKILFTEQEQKDNIKISIIRNSNESSAEALSIISIRLPDETGKMVINRYMFKPGSELISISKEDLQANFDSETMGYVKLDDPVIPGIKR